MLVDKSKKYCYGCGVCAGICPVGAMEVKMSKEGTYVPIIDKAKCTNCKLCSKICPWRSFDYRKVDEHVYDTENIQKDLI